MGGQIQSDGAIERIQVICGSQCRYITGLIYGFLTSSLQGGGNGGGGGSYVLRNTLETPDPPPPCDQSDFTNELGLSEAQIDAIFDFINSPNAQAMWDASNFSSVVHQRLEQAGWLTPSGQYIPAQIVINSYCHVTVAPPGNLPEGSILIHTHPYRKPEWLSGCGSNEHYQNEPSLIDHGWIGTFDNVQFGLILDYDGFIIFDAYDYQFVDGQCGPQRTGQ